MGERRCAKVPLLHKKFMIIERQIALEVTFLKKITITAFCTFVLMITGCTIMAPSYMPDYTAVDALKRRNISKIAIESVEPKDPNAKVNKITLRGGFLASPSGNYAKYLEDALKSDLSDANLLDQNSLMRLSAFLLHNDINVAGFDTGYGTIEARFSINRNGVALFDKIIAAETVFDSSFAAAVGLLAELCQTC